jgi:VWFA-related protein
MMTFPLPPRRGNFRDSRNRSTLALVLLLVHPSFGQSPPPGHGSAAPSTAPEIKVSSRLVVLDVVVSGEHNQPVAGLNHRDFTVLENNVPQTLSQFEEHTSATSPSTAAALPKLPPNVFTNFTRAVEGSPVNILLLDALNTPLTDQSYVRSQMLDYLKNIHASARVAIFGLSSRLFILQGFTSDPELLRSAIKTNKSAGHGPSLLADTGQSTLADTLSDDASFGNSPGATQIIANLQQFESQQAAFQTTLRTEYTLDALNQLARYLSGIPGRKNLIWFSGSFPLNIAPDGSLPDPFANVADFTQELRKTTDAMTLAQVAVYPVDARGLFNNPAFNASSSGANFAKKPGAALDAISNFNSQTIGEHATMDQMAEATGGKAFYNDNGLKQAVSEAIELGANYYTLAYAPKNGNWNGKFRKIQIKLTQPGYRLSYRRGYFADSPAIPLPTLTSSVPKPMQSAMLRGAPDPTQIIFDVGVRRSDTPEETLPKDNRPDAKLLKGPFRRYGVDYGADMRDVLFVTTPDGVRHANLELTTVVYDAEGRALNSVSDTIHADVKRDSYIRLLDTGLSFHQEVGVPAAGTYFLRIGVHDISSDKVGAIEIPTSAVKDISVVKPAARPSR